MSWERVEGDITKGPWGLFKWVAIGTLSAVVLFGGINLLTKPAGMAVERIVMKQSFQYKEGMEQRAATLQANLADPDITVEQRKYLQAQLRAITINQ